MSDPDERSSADREADRRQRAARRGSGGGRGRAVSDSPRAPRGRPPGRPHRRPVSARRRWTRRIGALVFLALIVVVLWLLASIYEPFGGGGNGSGQVEVTIPADASTSQIGSLLARDGVVDSGFFFTLRAKLDGDHFRAGTFTLAQGMSLAAAINALTRGRALPQVTNVTIVPGKSRYQLDQLLRSQGVRGSYLRETIRSSLLNPQTYGAPRGTPSLEGFLYPDTFQLRRPIRLSALIADQLTEFKDNFSQVNFAYAKSKNLTEYDVLKIASLEVAEAATPGDLRKVASVIYNRLRLGMDLGLDTTAAYAANNYTGNLTTAQLDSRSPWNTLNHPGLPPTPINSPGLDAIEAAAKPANTDYLYFIVKVCGNGSLAFTNNYQVFLGLSAAYARSLAAKGATRTEFCSATHG